MATGSYKAIQKELKELRETCEFKRGMHKLFLDTASLELDFDKQKEYEERAQYYLNAYQEDFERLDYLLWKKGITTPDSEPDESERYMDSYLD